jgi:hypothetical protein
MNEMAKRGYDVLLHFPSVRHEHGHLTPDRFDSFHLLRRDCEAHNPGVTWAAGLDLRCMTNQLGQEQRVQAHQADRRWPFIVSV